MNGWVILRADSFEYLTVLTCLQNETAFQDHQHLYVLSSLEYLTQETLFSINCEAFFFTVGSSSLLLF